MKELSHQELDVLRTILVVVRNNIIKSDFVQPQLAYIENGKMLFNFTVEEYQSLLSLYNKAFGLPSNYKP